MPRRSAGGLESGFARQLRYRLNSVDDLNRKSFRLEVIQSYRGVFDDVMEDGCHSFLRGGNSEHQAQGMKQVWSASLVNLAGMGLGCNFDGLFDSAHVFSPLRPNGT